MTKPVQPSQTGAFYAQAVASFGISVTAMVMVMRVDQARLDKLLTEHDPFKVDV
jgi:hypothetical protein